MAEKRRKSASILRANKTVRWRTVLVMAVMGVLTFAALFVKLYELQVLRHDELQELASAQQTGTHVLTSSRGTIYDANGNVLAISTPSATVFIAPKEILAYEEEQQEKGERVIRDADFVVRGLSRILEIEREEIERHMQRVSSQYEVLARKAEKDMIDEVNRFRSGEIDDQGREVPEGSRVRLRGIYTEDDPKRIYPYGTLAANVIGFVNSEGNGALGLESKYNATLTGSGGLRVSAHTNTGVELLYQYEREYEASDGYSLRLTLDTNVQSYLEKGMAAMLNKFSAANGGAGIVMNCKTGAILAEATFPYYDSSDPGTVIDSRLLADLNEKLADIESRRDSYESEEAYNKAVSAAKSAALNTQWRNKVIDSTYEPGSTFKPITLAAALEEGVVDLDTTFNCEGRVMVQGWDKPFWCSNNNGHGLQSLMQATGNSCNPAFINMGLRIGTAKYYQYLRSFGFMDKTGVDMIGEVQGIFASEQNFRRNVVSLASYAFGQTFTTTPVQLIRAQAACINGGYLLTPHIVDAVVDDAGRVISTADTEPVRQVISQETSATVRECLEYVVASGTGKNGQVAGYRLGGKTGTADKTGTDDVVVSFMCFAPADDPEYIMLITMDTPSRYTGTYVSGGNMVAPTAASIMAEILPYLGVEPDYTAGDLASADKAVINVIGKSGEEGRALLEGAGFQVKTVGDGAAVTAQTPVGGAIVPNDACITLYLGVEKPTEPATVPDLAGMTPKEARAALENRNLILRASGASTSVSGVRAISQSAEPGAELSPGSVVTVQFGDASVRD